MKEASMKYKIFKFNKLCRDKTIERMESGGAIMHWYRLQDEDFKDQLKQKLLEEAQEVIAAQSNTELIDELADILEVIDTFIQVCNISMQDIVAAQTSRRELRGGFEDRIFVTKAELPDTHSFLEYFLADPDKYPEIID